MATELQLAFAHYEDMVARHACGDRSVVAVSKARERIESLITWRSDAAMPAAPSDADALKQWAWHWFGPDADEEWIAKALANLPSAALSQTRGVDQRALEVAASFIQLHAPDSPLYGDLRSIAARIQPATAGEQAGAVAPPELPEPSNWFTVEYVGAPSQQEGFYTADQMREYGAACTLAAPGSAIAARETNATIIYGALSDQARQRTSRENIEDVLAALASRDEAPATPQREIAITDAMVDAYLKAQRETVERVDREWGGKTGKAAEHLHPVREACRNGLRAALTQPTTVQQAGALGLLRRSEYFVSAYADRNPKWDWAGTMQDPSGVHALLAEIRANLKGMQPGERGEG